MSRASQTLKPTILSTKRRPFHFPEWRFCSSLSLSHSHTHTHTLTRTHTHICYTHTHTHSNKHTQAHSARFFLYLPLLFNSLHQRQSHIKDEEEDGYKKVIITLLASHTVARKGERDRDREKISTAQTVDGRTNLTRLRWTNSICSRCYKSVYGHRVLCSAPYSFGSNAAFSLR